MTPRAVAAAVFLVAAAAHARRACPTIYHDDSPETVTAAATLGVAHPPGDAPLALLGRLACALPVGSPAFRMNLLAGWLFAGVAAGLAVQVPATGSPLPARFVAALTALLAVQCHPALARYTGVAKGATYGLNLLLLMWAVRPFARGCWAATALPAGVLAAHHWMTAGLYLPAFALASRALAPRIPGGFRARTVVLSLAVGTAGLSPFVALPIRSAAHPALDWNATRTVAGMGRHLGRTDFVAVERVATSTTIPRQAGAILASLGGALAIPGCLLALLGWASLRARARPPMTPLAGAALLLPPTAMALYFRLSPDKYYLYDAFLMPTWLMLAALAVRGGTAAVSLPRRWRAVGAVALLVLWPASQWRAIARNDVRASTWGFDLGRALLRSMPAGSGLALSADLDTFPVWHAQMVIEERPGVPVVHTLLLRHRWYRIALGRPPADRVRWLGPASGGLPRRFLRGFAWRGYFEAARRLPDPLATAAVGYTNEALTGAR